ncbi:MAG: hypothetical protein AVDCRST_MAG72-612, partial [uncultured Nocardioidaceae bacterium]
RWGPCRLRWGPCRLRWGPCRLRWGPCSLRSDSRTLPRSPSPTLTGC